MKRSFKKTAALITAAIMTAGFATLAHAEPVTINGVVFDADYYARNNPDVAAAVGLDTGALFSHYVSFGQAEGRLPYEATDASVGETADTSPDFALTDESIKNAMYALKADYPEGTRWNNDNYYGWKGGTYSGGYGCAGFAFMLSDAAFGDARATTYHDASAVRVGDIARMINDTHSVIILEVRPNSVIVAEGNYNNSVHWGREISKKELESADYFMTRY